MKTQTQPINIILADDHEIFRDGFRSMINNTPSINLLAEASSAKELLVKTRELRPDVIVTNVEMQGIEGILETKKLIKKFPSQKIIALSMCEDERKILDILELGAQGYLQRNAPKEEIVAAVKSVFKNETFYCNNTKKRLAELAAININRHGAVKTKIDFTQNEVNVIKMICKEFGNKEIAEHLGLSKRTVEGYREKILEKIKAKNTAGIVIHAIKNKIYEVNVNSKNAIVFKR